MPQTTTHAFGSSLAFQSALMRWYEDNHRKLPWRTTPSLYRTVVSEFMLQQTQVKTVLPYFDAWMDDFPDFGALAAASEQEILKAWEGLGYYRRARNLHALAKAYVAANPKPTTAAQWRELPGIGPYTAAAIASIAHGEEIAVVDGNVVRILTRLFADEDEYKDASSAGKALTPFAEKLIRGATNPGDHNQAMMELGATLCSRGDPLCPLCPVKIHCAAWAKGNPARYPRLAKRVTKKVVVERVWIEQSGKLLLHKIPDNARRLAGLYELPEAQHVGFTPGKPTPLLVKKRGIANEQIEERITRAAPEGLSTGQADLHWVSLEALDTISLSGPHKKWIAQVRARTGH